VPVEGPGWCPGLRFRPPTAECSVLKTRIEHVTASRTEGRTASLAERPLPPRVAREDGARVVRAVPSLLLAQ